MKIALKLAKVKIELKSVIAESIGKMGTFLLKYLSQNYTISQLGEVTGFDKDLLVEGAKILQRRRLMEPAPEENPSHPERWVPTKKGKKVLEVLQFIDEVNRKGEFITDLYSEELTFYKGEELKPSPSAPLYPPKLYEYGLLKKLEKGIGGIIRFFGGKFDPDQFEIEIVETKFLYYEAPLQFSKKATPFEVGVPYYHLYWELKPLNGGRIPQKISSLFRERFFNRFDGKEGVKRAKFRGKFRLPSRYPLPHFELGEAVIPFNQIALIKIIPHLEETFLTYYLNLEEMLKPVVWRKRRDEGG
jgi:hypothetical protein